MKAITILFRLFRGRRRMYLFHWVSSAPYSRTAVGSYSFPAARIDLRTIQDVERQIAKLRGGSVSITGVTPLDEWGKTEAELRGWFAEDH